MTEERMATLIANLALAFADAPLGPAEAGGSSKADGMANMVTGGPRKHLQSVALRAPRAPLALENWTSTEFQKH
jgi:hypothetical protein